VEVSYDPVLGSCITLATRRGLTNAIGVLVVDIVLLMIMLIGLLKHSYKSSTGIWYLLYQQVTRNLSITLTLDAEDLRSASSGYS
jgi:hypothetical protein